MKKQNIVVGTLILSASSIFVRLIGFVFRVYLSNTMGAEGIGVHSLIMSLYGLSSTLAAACISVAVSKLVAEEVARGNHANGKKILRSAVGIAAVISCVVAAVIFLFADFFAVNVLQESRTALSLRFLAPGLPFMSISSCMRGYFIAKRNVGNPASGQVVEQLIKMAFIIGMIGYWLPKGLEYGCAVVVLGITIGEVVCFFYTAIGYVLMERKNRSRQKPDIKAPGAAILGISVPLTLSMAVRSALRLWEDVLVLAGLKAFTGQADVATGTYGMLKGMVMPLLIFPLSLLSAFAVTLTPEISRLEAGGSRERLDRMISKILQYTTILGIFVVCVFMAFSYELGVVVYKDESVGEMLRLMSLLCPFMCVDMVVVSILQGLGEQFHSVAYSMADCIIRVVMVFFLVPLWGVKGFLIMIVVSNLFTSVLNLVRLMKVTGVKLQFNDWIIKPVLAAVAAVQGVRFLYDAYLSTAMPMWMGVTVGSIVVAIVYILVMMSLGCIKVADFSWFADRMKFSANRHGEERVESGI